MLLFDDLVYLVDFIGVELAILRTRTDAGGLQNIVRLRPPDAVDIRQPDFDSLIRRKIYAGNTCHFKTSSYPCRCLCFGITQMTRTTRLRCTILHLSQIFLTEPRTFIIASNPNSYLYRYTIRPLVRSYGESSTATLSPGRIRIKFFHIFPAI